MILPILVVATTIVVLLHEAGVPLPILLLIGVLAGSCACHVAAREERMIAGFLAAYQAQRRRTLALERMLEERRSHSE